MKLAVVDNAGTVLVTWPTPADGHADLADAVAEKLAPRRWHGRRRTRYAAVIRTHVLALQEQTRHL